MVSMRLKGMGQKERPYYRIIVSDSRLSRTAAAIEELGYYHPVEKDNQVFLKEDRIKDWLKKGAKPSETVKKILNKNGIQMEK